MVGRYEAERVLLPALIAVYTGEALPATGLLEVCRKRTFELSSGVVGAINRLLIQIG